MKQILAITLVCLSFNTQALDLPNPLTLGDALKLTKNQNLDEQQQHINISLDRVKLDSYQDAYKPKVDLDLQLARRANENSGTNNSHAFVKINQVLFDQNTNIGQNTARSNLESTQFQLQQLKKDKTTQVMRAFFDVILSDMRYETVLERLAISAIREGRVKDDFDTKDASEVELLEKQTQTQLDVSKRIEAESLQITTRAKLAQLLNITYENRPDDLVRPNLKHFFENELGEFEIWQKKILNSNPDLDELERELVSLKQQINSEKNNKEIVISSNARLGEQAYQRDKNGKWRVGLNFVMPLGQSYSQKRKITELSLKIKQKKLSIDQLKQNLNQRALSLWLELKTLKQLQKALTVELDYRDLYLERARANYEMEIKSDIGHAMTNLTDSEWKLAKNEFNYVVTLTQLRQLAGENHGL